MISIDKTKIEKPKVLSNDRIVKLLKKRITEDKPGKKIAAPYNDKEVRKQLRELYHDKCAYCEDKIQVSNATPRIEHYRPKDGIKEVQNHKGYFWLGYEWTNLLLACEVCNNKAHKSNKFPLKNENSRVSDDLEKEGFIVDGEFDLEQNKATSAKLMQEERLLLNPELDEVEQHFYFTPQGQIKPYYLEGEVSIEVYGLDREDLIKARRKIVFGLITKLITLFTRYDESDYSRELKYFFGDELENIDNPTKAFSRFGFFIKEFFDLFVIDVFRQMDLTMFSKILEDNYRSWKEI
jgi:uncharacterized protein (TIGR02646 family)